MSRFLTPLDLRQLGRRRWMLLAPLLYDSDLIGHLCVPAEFICDLASVPRWLPVTWYLTGDSARGPAVIHDYLYQHPESGDRQLADAVFREAMAVHQPDLGFEAEPTWRRGLMWAGVRVGGWKAWRDHGKRVSLLNPIWTETGWPDLTSPGA